MATYFHGSSEFQAASVAAPDGMQTLYLMNPNYIPYSDTNQPVAATNLFFLNPAGNALNPSSSPHTPPPNYHHLLGLPLPTPTASIVPANSNETHRPSSLHGIVSGVHYNSWGSCSTIDHQTSSASTYPQIGSTAVDNSAARPHDVASQLRPVVVSPRQGLSLSLSSQQVPYSSSNVEADHIQGQVPTMSPAAADEMRISGNSPSSASVVSNGIPGVQSVVLGSKYLRAAQELLDEVVNVGKVIKPEGSEGTKEKIKADKEPVGSSAGGDGAQRGPDLTTAQRQELQMKKAKLVSMLDEVEQRYRQYRQQMQIVVSSLEKAAGFGAAKSYTGLASRTISKQFRCLKDSISEQIKATSKSLGEDDCLGVKLEGSRLRYVDYQLRQQRALQQLGMIQHNNNVWRPQRGLPERAVSVLRAWLFEHFLHPYPKDSDKHMLAKQTGLTRNQVSNWFINARVRLWKPMVEEMYLEEMKEHERKGGEENTNKSEQKESGSTSSKSNAQQQEMNASPTHQFSNSTISTSPMERSLMPPQTSFNLIGSSELDNGVGVAQRASKKSRNVNDELQNSPMEMKPGETWETNINMIKLGDEERLLKHSFSYLSGTTYTSMGEIGRFNEEQQLPPKFHGSSVSLTLGLPHCENLSLSGNPQNFLSNHNIQLGINTPHASHSNAAGFDNIHEMQNRQRFAAQLLPDFVA
ncbi:BEL1-like homeodomain protein 1 [Gossypium australe]|uniref:BEL1-like homeodomain protein 1 n=1 Tax=Gossypium australe TaxID=47621 RepID=A0A5B6UNT3_9ROSI|nr:BEL1-like homeodomain protein 1 [Gossypium australe]